MTNINALRDALLQGQLPCVQALLQKAPELIEARDERGIPLSHYGAASGNFALVRYLVEYTRTSLNTLDGNGRDFLHYAAQGGDIESCRYLCVQCGMDSLRGDKDAITPYETAHAQGHTALEAYFETLVGAPLSQMYKNPIRRGMFPDPSIVRVGEDYYMVNSSFVFFPCLPISHSRDLVHWHIIGHAITNPEWAMLEGLDGGRGYWAPDISYCDGLFYICATYRLNDGGNVLRRQMVVTATAPEGPYSKPAFIDEDGIDPSLFHDDDGRHYMLLNRGARILEIDRMGTKALSPARLLYYGDHKRAPEGPHLLKKDGWYYLFLAEGGTGLGHRETVARARSLMGPYERCPHNPILYQSDPSAALQRCGHAKPVCTQHGDWYLLYLCGRTLAGEYTFLGRETAMDPITWTAEGWPLVNQGRGPSVLQKCPAKLPPSPALSDGDDYWTPRVPPEGSITSQGDCILLRGSSYPLTDTRCRSIYVRRQTDFAFTYTMQVQLEHMENGAHTGITCYYDEHSFLLWGVKRTNDALHLFAYEQNGAQALPHDALFALPPSTTTLTLQVRTQERSRTLAFLSEGRMHDVLTLENVTYLSDEGVSFGKRFTGAMVGLYAVGDVTALFSQRHYFSESTLHR